MPRTWRSTVYLLLALPIGVVSLTWFVTMLSLGVSTLIVWVGVPILVATFASTRGFAGLERRRAGWLLGEAIPAPYLPGRRRGMVGALRSAIADAAIWKDLLWLVILLPGLGLAGFTLAVCAWGTALGTLCLPAWYWTLSDNGIDYGLIKIDTLDEAWLGVPAGLLMLAIAVPLTRGAAYALGALVAEAHTEAKRALEELRDLSRGIYPAILTDRGLGPALSSIAARNPVEVALDVDVDGRLPAATEAAAYFVTVEALTNVAKHSGAEHARVRIARRADTLRVEIVDDGEGGADPAGAGLTGLRQRVEALDGSLVVQSSGVGTTIRAELPCASSSPRT